MNRNIIIACIVTSLIASACNSQQTPAVSPIDIKQTAESGAFTMIAQTQEIVPTATPVPPTVTATQTLTQPRGVVTLSLYVVTELGECGYLSQQFEKGGGLDGPVGYYTAGAFVDGKKNFRVFGSFRITRGSWNIFVRNENIVALGGCAPNC
jgi:hypothetical protein